MVMFPLSTLDGIQFIALFLEGLLYGVYTGIFAIYLRYQASKQDTDKTQNILFYSMCTLYVTSAFLFICDIATFKFVALPGTSLEDHLVTIQTMQIILFACSDFTAQIILIHRCWIVWGRDIRIVIIPSILAFTFFGIWIGSTMSTTNELGASGGLLYSMTLTGFALSLTVNALVTGLIVFRIFQVFREVRATSDDKILSITGGSKLRRIIMVLIESAMVLFSIQLTWLTVNILGTVLGYPIIVVTYKMLNGITPTIILVRISMGLSFHDEKSMEESAIGTLRFASNHPAKSVPEMGSISVVGQDNRDDDDIDVQRSNDIDIMDEHT